MLDVMDVVIKKVFVSIYLLDGHINHFLAAVCYFDNNEHY